MNFKQIIIRRATTCGLWKLRGQIDPLHDRASIKGNATDCKSVKWVFDSLAGLITRIEYIILGIFNLMFYVIVISLFFSIHLGQMCLCTWDSNSSLDCTCDDDGDDVINLNISYNQSQSPLDFVTRIKKLEILWWIRVVE